MRDNVISGCGSLLLKSLIAATSVRFQASSVLDHLCGLSNESSSSIILSYAAAANYASLYALSRFSYLKNIPKDTTKTKDYCLLASIVALASIPVFLASWFSVASLGKGVGFEAVGFILSVIGPCITFFSIDNELAKANLNALSKIICDKNKRNNLALGFLFFVGGVGPIMHTIFNYDLTYLRFESLVSNTTAHDADFIFANKMVSLTLNAPLLLSKLLTRTFSLYVTCVVTTKLSKQLKAMSSRQYLGLTALLLPALFEIGMSVSGFSESFVRAFKPEELGRGLASSWRVAGLVFSSLGVLNDITYTLIPAMLFAVGDVDVAKEQLPLVTPGL